jgi:uncharacterized membrane protein
MATRKSSGKPQVQPMADSNEIWKWVYVIGLVVAGVIGAIGFKNDIVGWILIVVGILSGIFFLNAGDIVNFAIRFLLLGAVWKALDSVPVAGAYISGFFGGVFAFLTPVGLTLLVKYFWEKYFSTMM